MDLLMLLAISVTHILCFLVGAKVGQQSARGETIRMPIIDPVAVMKAHEEKVEASHQQKKAEAILANVEAYDGTPAGQKDIPWR